MRRVVLVIGMQGVSDAQMWFASHLGSGRERLEDAMVAKLFEAVTRLRTRTRKGRDRAPQPRGGRPESLR